jgi:hypothetical protein
MFMVAASPGEGLAAVGTWGRATPSVCLVRGSTKEVATMRTLGTLLSSAAALALACGAVADAKPKKPGPTPVTQPCVLSGDATGGGEVGVSVTAYGNLAMTVSGGTNLAVVLPAGSYSGIGRVLKGKRSRLDFGFNDDGLSCRLPESADGPPPNTNPEVCQYQLILAYGTYDREADLVVFEGSPDATALLYDRQQSLNEDGFLDPIATGYAILNVQFE